MGNAGSSGSHKGRNAIFPPMLDSANKAFEKLSKDGRVISIDDWKKVFKPLLSAFVYRFFHSKPTERDDFCHDFYNLYELRTPQIFTILGSMEEFIYLVLETADQSSSSDEFTADIIKQSARVGPAAFVDHNCPGLVQNVLMCKLQQVMCPTPEYIVYATKSSLLSPLQLLIAQSALPDMVYFQNKRPCDIELPCWHILYQSAEHGLSVNGFESKVFGYQSPTVAIFKLSDGQIFVLASDSEWRHTTKFFGSSFTKCFRIAPTFKIFESRAPEPIFCNFKYRTSNFGLGYKEAFEVNAHFGNVHAIEVWGCGDDAALKAQAAIKLRQRMAVERNQKVPLPGNWDDNPDKVVLEMAGFNFSSERDRAEPPLEE